jgi:hypothetical protein
MISRRREAQLREALQILQSRQRVALTALECFWQRLLAISRERLSIGDIEELSSRMDAIRTVLGEGASHG